MNLPLNGTYIRRHLSLVSGLMILLGVPALIFAHPVFALLLVMAGLGLRGVLAPPQFSERPSVRLEERPDPVNGVAVLIHNNNLSTEVCSEYWRGFLGRFWGAVRVRGPESVADIDLRGTAITVYADAEAEGIEAAFQTLVPWVKRGGVLILEGAPGEAWQRFFSGVCNETSRPGALLDPSARAAGLLEPGLVRHGRLDRGLIMIVNGVSHVHRVLRHGPENPKRKRPWYEPGVFNSYDLAACEPGIDAEPWADKYEEDLVALIQRFVPLPTLRPFDNRPGLIMTHDEDHLGDASLPFLRRVAEAGCKPTLYLMPDTPLTPEGASALHDLEVTPALHWSRFPVHVDGRGIHINQDATLAQQIQRVEALCGKEIRHNRTHWLCLGRNVDNHFGLLAENRIASDSTQGAYADRQGPLFGANLPFFKMDAEGRMLDLLEIPFLMYDPNPQDFAKVFQRVCVRERSLLTLLLHPHSYMTAEGKASLKAILEQYHEHSDDVVSMSIDEVNQGWRDLVGFEWRLTLPRAGSTHSSYRVSIDDWTPGVWIRIPGGSAVEPINGSIQDIHESGQLYITSRSNGRVEFAIVPVGA